MQKNQNPNALGLTRVKYPQYSGYDEYLDDAGNKIYWDKKVKQWVECVSIDMPMGGRVSSPRQVEAQGTLIDRNKANGRNDEYQQIFIKSLRELFWQTDVTKHRNLGYLLMILHQISCEYNILCWNPEEQDRSKVRTMSLGDFCKSMGTDGHTEDQRQRLLEAYRALKFTIDGTEQYLVAYLEDHVAGKFYLVLNPNLLYRGHDCRQVDGFGSFFKNLST